MDEFWLCNRCLAVLDVRSAIVAATKTDPPALEPFPGAATNVAALRAWAEDKIASGEWRINMDDRSDAFAPVSTWHGDPVCVVHLRLLAGHEMSGRWY